MQSANFTIIMNLRIDDVNAGHIVQWDSYYFKFSLYQTTSKFIQLSWIDKGSW